MSEVSLRDIMRVFPQGVVVVTARDSEGPRGITVSSFMSISLSPPLVTVCIMNEARAHAPIKSGRFLVNVLAEDQGPVSDHFATPNLSSEEQFDRFPAGPPIGGSELSSIEGALGYLSCKVVDEIVLSDHTLFIGEVEHAQAGREAKPLVFCSREYWGLGSTVHDRG